MFGCLSCMPNSPSRRNRSMYGLVAAIGLRVGQLGIAEAAAQHFDGVHLARLAVHGAKHAGKRAGADAIQHLIIAVEEAGARFVLHQPLELILRQQPAAQESLLKRGQRHVRGAELAPHRLQLRIVDDVDVQCALGQLFRGFDIGHGTQLRDCSDVRSARSDFRIPAAWRDIRRARAGSLPDRTSGISYPAATGSTHLAPATKSAAGASCFPPRAPARGPVRGNIHPARLESRRQVAAGRRAILQRERWKLDACGPLMLSPGWWC